MLNNGQAMQISCINGRLTNESCGWKI